MRTSSEVWMRRVGVALAAIAIFETGCAGPPPRRPEPAPAAARRATEAAADTGRIELEIEAGGRRVLAVGDTLHLRPQLAEVHGDAAFVRPTARHSGYTWLSSRPDVATVGADDGVLVARAVGDAIVELRGEGREAFATFSVIPRAVSVRWEPAELALRVGERAVVRAVALDGAGRVVALLPLASVGGTQGVLARAEQSRDGGWIALHAEHPGTTYLTAYLGPREAQLRVTISP